MASCTRSSHCRLPVPRMAVACALAGALGAATPHSGPCRIAQGLKERSHAGMSTAGQFQGMSYLYVRCLSIQPGVLLPQSRTGHAMTCALQIPMLWQLCSLLATSGGGFPLRSNKR